MLTTLCTTLALALTGTPCTTSVPPLHKWQAARVARWLAFDQHRPLYRVVRMRNVSPVRVKVVGHEPGYLGDNPDVTTTVVERRIFQLWVRDPWTGDWSRRL